MQKDSCMNMSIVQIYASFVIYHENHNKCYYFTDTSELWSAPSCYFSIWYQFVLCKDRHLYISHSRLQNVNTNSLQVSHTGAK